MRKNVRRTDNLPRATGPAARSVGIRRPFWFNGFMRPFLALTASLLAAAPAAAHPLTELRFDRTAAVRAGADGVAVRYKLEVSALALQALR